MNESGSPQIGFPVIGLGASAGGLEALQAFFGALDADTGMAFVVAMHLAPDHSSAIPELLNSVASIPVISAEDGREVWPNEVYVIPPGKLLELRDGRLLLSESHREGRALAIDVMFESIAEDYGRFAAGIVFSGTGSDGSNGIKKIKAYEGLVFAQLVETAQYSSMPQSAIDTGSVDLAVAPSEMPGKLVRHFSQGDTDGETAPADQNVLSRIFAVLRQRLGHDFSGHKESTLRRRLLRRMALRETEDPEEYLGFLRENGQEAQALYREFLIGVTHFFRDPDTFSVLSEKVLPNMIRNLPDDESLRIWVPGCSTGEEAFTLAMLLREVMESEGKSCPFQIFGTDLDEHSIEIARAGRYPLSIATDVSEERLQRFFKKEKHHYQIRKEIRDTIVFSVHDLLSDAPFSRLHLLCCRNVLIYLKPAAQKKILPLFHYTLNPGGVLLLGSSESIGGFTNLFETVDQKQKIFRRKNGATALQGTFQFPTGASKGEYAVPNRPEAASGKSTAESTAFLTQQLLLEQFGPDAVLVEGDGSIVYVQGKTGRYLEAVTGPPSSSILDLARPGLSLELAAALRTAKTREEKVVHRDVTIYADAGKQIVDLHVVPIKTPSRLAGCFLVVFRETSSDEEVSRAGTGSVPEADTEQGSRIGELEEELRKTRESHQSTVEELESTNEELKSTNEELQSANEELQSTNEEHESSKEELQSLNEELLTTNNELEHKIGELQSANDDIRNIFNSTEVASIFVDHDLKVRRFTEQAKNIVNLIDEDVGRSLAHLTSNLDYQGLQDDLQTATENLETREKEVQTKDGVWYKMRVFPYRTSDNKIDGAVLTFLNIDDQKRAQEQLEKVNGEAERAWLLFRSVFDMNPKPLVVLDGEGRIVGVNDALSDVLGMTQSSLKGTEFTKLPGHDQNRQRLDESLKDAVRSEETFYIGPIDFGTDDDRRFTVAGSVIRQDDGLPYRLLLRLEEYQDE